MSLVLGLDVSTTATKAVLQDADGIVRAVGTSSYPYETPQPLWSEQDPGLWWDATRVAVRVALDVAGTDASAVQAVGLTGQMHGLVALDDRDEVLRPAILWNDQRTAAECDAIREIVGRARLIAITGNDALPGFTAPKLLWLRRHEPEYLGGDRACAPAQGLRAAPAHRRARRGPGRRFRDDAVRPRGAGLVRRDR